MSENNNGGPAFPTTGDPMAQAQAVGCGMRYLPPQGMSLRDYFAAKSMPIMWDAYDKGYCGILNPDSFDNYELAKGAYAMADAMLKARDA